MEECNSKNDSKKRSRDDSGELDSNSPELKRVNAGTDSDLIPPESEPVDTEIKPDSPESERVDTDIKRDSPEPPKCQHDSEDNSAKSNGAENELDSLEVVKFREDILDILDEPEVEPEIQDLDSVIRSFEEEILQSSPSLAHPLAVSDSGESQPDLGYLLEASDDELGLPPTVSQAQIQNQPSIGNDGADNGLGNIVGFENELPSYDSFEFGLGERVTDGNNHGANGNADVVTVDGLFDYSDGSDFGWRPESLPAL